MPHEKESSSDSASLELIKSDSEFESQDTTAYANASSHINSPLEREKKLGKGQKSTPKKIDWTEIWPMVKKKVMATYSKSNRVM